jgi:YidC/Oxa1 family membrane protein insertase
MLHPLNHTLGVIGGAFMLVGGILTGINRILGPLYHVLAALLAFWYGVFPNYAFAIALFTITVMVVLAPLTVKSTRSMLAMQRLQPEVKKIQAKYKGDRQAMNEELMALYKEHGVSPAGGCLPMFIQLPVFWVLYQVILGLTHLKTDAHNQPVMVSGHTIADPKYISHHSLLYQHLVAAHGHMLFLGFDLGKTAFNAGGGVFHLIPYWLLIAVCIGLQYLQMKQLSGRNLQQDATGTAAQMQKYTKFMPLIFGIIYIEIPAGVNIYFFISSLFRIGQQELMYRYDPQLKAHLAAGREARAVETVERARADRSPQAASPPGQGSGGGGLLASLRAARAELVSSGGGGQTKRGSEPTWSRQGQGARTQDGTSRPGARERPSGGAPQGARRAPQGVGRERTDRERGDAKVRDAGEQERKGRVGRAPDGEGPPRARKVAGGQPRMGPRTPAGNGSQTRQRDGAGEGGSVPATGRPVHSRPGAGKGSAGGAGAPGASGNSSPSRQQNRSRSRSKKPRRPR